MRNHEPSAQIWKMVAALAAARSEGDAAGAIARAAAILTDSESAQVWLLDHLQGYRFAGAWPREATAPESPPGEFPRAVAFGTVSITKGENGARSQIIIPLHQGQRPLGGIVLRESCRSKGAFTESDAEDLDGVLTTADEALPAIRERFKRRQHQIETVVRLTRLFDMGRSLTAATEIDDLQRLLVDRVRTSLEVQSAYLWRQDESEAGKISVVAAAGAAVDAVQGWQMEKGEGLAGLVFQTGEAVLVAHPDEIPHCDERVDVAAGLPIYSAAAAPLLSDEGEVQGVLEVVNAEGVDPHLEPGHLAFLEEVARTGVVALGNALRLEAEKRAGDLGAILEAVQSLAETLDLDRIAYTLVHQSAVILPYKRAAVGLYVGTRLELKAVSGETTLDEKLPEMKRLKDVLEWAAGQDEGLYIVQGEDGSIDTPRPETQEKFRSFFESTGARSFLAVPLRDDEGRLGVFAMEAEKPYAFEGREIEAVELLTVTTTTAVRNATLYQAIPKVFAPLGKMKHKVRTAPWWKRLSWLAGTAAAAVVLFLIPVPLRVGGEARVLPELRRPVVSEVEGRVTRVLVQEGDPVGKGQVVATLDDADFRAGEEDALARHEIALREQSRLRADGRTAEASIEAARVTGLKAEVNLWHSRLARTRIRATVSGVVATPRVEELTGTKLARGQLFCEVVDPGLQRIEVAVYEQDAGLIAPGMQVKVKLRAYPTRSFRAEIDRISVAAVEVDGGRVFLARARLLAPPKVLRSGMTGEAKISVGSASIARVALRRPGRWLWGILWGWLP